MYLAEGLCLYKWWGPFLKGRWNMQLIWDLDLGPWEKLFETISSYSTFAHNILLACFSLFCTKNDLNATFDIKKSRGRPSKYQVSYFLSVVGWQSSTSEGKVGPSFYGDGLRFDTRHVLEPRVSFCGVYRFMSHWYCFRRGSGPCRFADSGENHWYLGHGGVRLTTPM